MQTIACNRKLIHNILLFIRYSYYLTLNTWLIHQVSYLTTAVLVFLLRLHRTTVVCTYILAIVDIETSSLTCLIVSSYIKFICREVDIHESNLLVSTILNGKLILVWQSKLVAVQINIDTVSQGIVITVILGRIHESGTLIRNCCF